MARKPKPWWRADRQAWFVTIDGTRYSLGADDAAAEREFHRLMSLPPEARAPQAAESQASGLTVADVLDRFLGWVQKFRAPSAYDWYRDHIQSFTDSLSKPGEMPVADLRPFHVVEWADRHRSWGANYRRGALIAIQRSFNWAAKLGYIASQPFTPC